MNPYQKTVWLLVIAAALCVGGPKGPGAQAPAPQILSEDEVTPEKLDSCFKAAFLKATLDKDNRILLEDGGMKSFVQIDVKKKTITFVSLWSLKESASEIDKLRLVNKFNDKLMLVRFCMPKPTVLWCDYQIKYEGGIPAFLVIDSYRTFVTVVKGAVSTQDPDDLIGSGAQK